MAAGAAFTFGFGVVWLILGLFRGRSSPAWVRFSILVVGIALGASITMMALRASGMPRDATQTAQQLAADRRVNVHFYVIFGIEFAAILLSVIALRAIHYPDYILSGIALIVGVHFFPLGALFRTPLYYGTALLGCAIGMAGFIIADARLRQKIVGLSFGVLLWATAVWITGSGLCGAPHVVRNLSI